jgi:hypothetical protein
MKRYASARSNRVHIIRQVSQCCRFSQQQTTRAQDAAEEPEVDVTTKTVKTAAGPLPISPLMDQAFIDAKSKWLNPKPKPLLKKLQWQKKLACNPFGIPRRNP